MPTRLLRILYQDEATEAARTDIPIMATAQLNRITQHIRRTLTAQSLGEATDAMLLERFTSQQDEAAFAVLVRRHGPMVLGVCRRMLHNLHDAEDAFQAAFLLFARKAGSVRQRESLASWLFAVSRRLALKVRAGADRRHAFEDQVKAMAPTELLDDLPAFGPEQRSILDEELGRLPEKYRAALVVCYLEGKTRSEAARLLGWKPGAVKIRLERGREVLRTRLTRRGLALSAGALATVLAEAGAASAVSPALVDATVRGAMLLGAGHAALAGVVSEQTLALVEGMRQNHVADQVENCHRRSCWPFGVLGSGTTWLLHPAAVAQAPDSPAPAPQAPPAEEAGDRRLRRSAACRRSCPARHLAVPPRKQRHVCCLYRGRQAPDYRHAERRHPQMGRGQRQGNPPVRQTAGDAEPRQRGRR